MANVLTKIMNDYDEENFIKFMHLLYKRAGYSVYMILNASIPFFATIVFPIVFGLSDTMFFIGMVLCSLSQVVSKITNVPLYNKINKMTTVDKDEVNSIRDSLRRANWLRALIALIGFLVIMVSYYRFV